MKVQCNIVLFGITGDLAQRKLIPALYALFTSGYKIRVIGVARRKMDREQFFELLRESLGVEESEDEKIKEFFASTEYINGDFKEENVYSTLENILGGEEESKMLFYLSVPQFVYNDILYGLKNHFALKESKIAIEKPFGNNLASFEELLKLIGRYSNMNKIYPIDHYLGKEWVYSIDTLQRQNPILSTLLKSSTLDSIQLSMLEKDGIKERGRFYENVGTLKDVFQNHLLQMLSLAMKAILPNATKAEIIELIQPPLGAEEVVIAQYERNGNVKGYKEEHYVAKDSSTETFFAVKLRLFTTPIYVRSGKRLTKDSTYIVFNFKNSVDGSYNRIYYNIQPERNIKFVLNSKGSELCATVPIDYVDKSYQILIGKMVTGERGEFFPEINEMRAAWRLTEKVEELIKNKNLHIKSYRSSSYGPDESEKLLEVDGRNWN